MDGSWLLWALLAFPAAAALGCLAARTARLALLVASAAGASWALLAAAVAVAAIFGEPVSAGAGWLYLDALSGFHLGVLGLVFGAGSLYAWGYFRRELAAGQFAAGAARRFGALWSGSAAAMALVLASNNLGLMWVGVEATTLLTAFLICAHVNPLSLEAMWKYLVVCSVGVAFAFVGTLLVAASARGLGVEPAETLLWTRLAGSAGRLDPAAMKLAFVFLVVGYGTKAGLAPMHSWLPDAHSQAPAPVSALFSGFMLSAALYCVMRCLPLVEGATGNAGWGRSLLVALGLVSVLAAAAFTVFQTDGKRLLAYSSVEHLGVIALGLGLGGLGAFAALWHTLNHSISKSLAFFSVGRLGQLHGTHDLEKLGGALRRSPVWGAGLLGAMLALIGVAPFAIFMSEFQVLRAAAEAGEADPWQYLTMALFLLGLGIVFVGVLRQAIAVAWGGPAEGDKEADGADGGRERPALVDALLVFGGLALVLLLGLWLPAPLSEAIGRAAAILGGRP